MVGEEEKEDSVLLAVAMQLFAGRDDRFAGFQALRDLEAGGLLAHERVGGVGPLERPVQEGPVGDEPIDATSLVQRRGDEQSEPRVRVLREGAVTRRLLETVLGDLLEPEDTPEGAADGAA